MFEFLFRLWQRLKNLFGANLTFAPLSESLHYKTLRIEELPDKMEANTIYVLGEGNYNWSVGMICPCGCGNILHMSLHKEGRPHWKIIWHNDGTVSLSPSVNRLVGCKSHFFFERGRVRWCKQ
ncbi:DUF6527 family protein [Desulfosporosinus sp. HMP52]|uniref:DUF6527 family protein n=1 Tax=Desulfosporosinus sp. HMP52 TaxID=1487923 RepID=UPI00068B4FC2|nr:DUF6527 family protein [Desulfosporosinus sp. HMP52]